MKSVYNMNYPEPEQHQHQHQQAQQMQQNAMAPPHPQASQQQGQGGQPGGGAAGAGGPYGAASHFETRYYSSPVIMQQPFIQSNGNQQMLPPQTQWVESYPVNNYLLIPNSTIQYNQSYGQKPPPPPQVVDQRQYQQAAADHHLHQQMAPPPPPQLSQAHHPHHMQMAAPGGGPVHHLAAAGGVGGGAHPQQGQAQSSHPNNPDANVIYTGFRERLRKLLPNPPLSKAETRPDINYSINQKRVKRRSKFTKEQDDLIVALKKKGKSWVEIAEISKVGSYLAARNRYQVIVGQQGNNNSSSWGSDDKAILRKKLDEAELEKWEFLASELNKATGKSFTSKDCRDAIQVLFFRNPLQFGVNEVSVQECEKEYKITEKANEQDYKNVSVQPYVQTLLANSSGTSAKPFDRQQLPQSQQGQTSSGGSQSSGGQAHASATATSAGSTSQQSPRQGQTNTAANAAASQPSAGGNGAAQRQADSGQPQPSLPHYKSSNSVFDSTVPYGFGEEYASSRSSSEPMDNYKMSQSNQMGSYY